MRVLAVPRSIAISCEKKEKKFLINYYKILHLLKKSI
jgi:hypothetical protein